MAPHKQEGFNMSAAKDHIANEFADMAANGLQWLRNIKDGISTVDEALAEMQANMDRIAFLQNIEYAARDAMRANVNSLQFVSTYLRTYRTWEGKLIEDEVAVFTELQGRAHGLHGFVEGKGYPLNQAAHLLGVWQALAVARPDTAYRLGPSA